MQNQDFVFEYPNKRPAPQYIVVRGVFTFTSTSAMSCEMELKYTYFWIKSVKMAILLLFLSQKNACILGLKCVYSYYAVGKSGAIVHVSAT